MAIHVLIHLKTGKRQDTRYHLIKIHVSRADVWHVITYLLLRAGLRGYLFYVSTDRAIWVLLLTLKSRHGPIFYFVIISILRQKIAN